MSERTVQLQVANSRPGVRLDTYLRGELPAVSRGAFKRLIDEGHVRVNDEKVKATYTPEAGDVVSIFFPEAKPHTVEAQEMALDILFEDGDLLVLNKPAGLVVHPAEGHSDSTLVNALLHHCAGELSGIGGVARPGIVHRLDKDTTGCLVVAKNDLAHQALSEQFAVRTITKVYHAVVCGVVVNDTGSIRAPIARNNVQRKKMAVVEGGREAWTTFKVLERFKAATLVEVGLHTGRTHQIRVHFQHIGYALLGDELYGKRPSLRLKETSGYAAPRQLLHSAHLAFVHPRTRETLRFDAPWPEDFAQAVEILRGGKRLS